MPDGRDGRVVLIVQEELVTRMDIAEEFDRAGFKVFQASSAERAIAILRDEPTIRVVFTDIDLPGRMDGVALAHYVRERWPPTILLVSSGRIPQRALPSKTHFVQQPYLDDGLANVVNQVSS
jgi:DNA-binding NtrC family response regulator